MNPDRKTIGVSVESERILKLVIEKTYFKEQADVARFAVSTSLSRGLKNLTEENLGTKWNVGTFDPTGEIRTAVEAFHPECTEPYRFMEGLIAIGLRFLEEHIKIHGFVDFELLLAETSQQEIETNRPVDETIVSN